MAKMQNASAAYVPISARPVVMNVVNTRWIIAGGVQKHAIGVQKNAGAWQGQWPKRRNAVAGPVTAFLTNELRSSAENSIANDASKLEQNNPNPFNTKTEINYFIANQNAKATLVVRDLNGNALKEFTLAQSGKGSVTVNANELAAGTYTYSLFVSDKCVDTKLMVITK